MTRDETRFSPNVGSLYSFVEVTNWTVTPTQCTFNQSGGITSSYYWSFTGYSQLEWGEGGTWHDFGDEESGYYGGYGDKVYDSHTSYFTRRSANRTVYLANYAHAYVNGQSTSARAYIQFTVPVLPPNATTLTATRNSDTSVALSWTEASGVKESVRIERSIDGSSFAEIATVSGSATSYTDNTTAADHTYTYRIRYYNKNAYGGYSSTSSVTMSPSAPTKITVARATSTNVNVTLTNPSSVATSIQWQVTYDGGSSWSSSTSVSGSPVRSFTASTNGGTVKIRVRNVNATGSSAWIVSDSVVTLVPPAPPTALEPSGIVNLKYGTLTFRWKHNPLDGSAQTEAHLHYEVGNQTADVPISGTASTYTIDIHSQAPGASYSWKVRTKGADPSYSDWSSTLSGKLYAEPQIYFIAQNPPSTVTALPIPIELGYSDPQFMACASAVMTVKRDGRTVYTEPLTIGSSRLTGQITAAELLPEQGATYTVSVTARSGSTLEATTNTTFTVDYIEPTHGTLQVQNEPETGYASLLATFDNHASDKSYTGNTNSGITVDGAAIRSMTVDGKSVQDGTPSPSAPVPIQVVGGANLLDPSKGGSLPSGSSYTNGGITFSRDNDVFSVSGTATTTYPQCLVTNVSKMLNDGSTYTITSRRGNLPSGGRLYVIVYGCDNASQQNLVTLASTRVNESVTFTVTKPYQYATVVAEGNNVAWSNVKLSVQLNAGSTAMPYVPYGSIGLKVSGKNLLDPNQGILTDGRSITAAGITFARENNVITISGTATTEYSQSVLVKYDDSFNLEIGKTYTLSKRVTNVPSGGRLYAIVYESNVPSSSGQSTLATLINADSRTFTPTKPYTHVIVVAQGNGVTWSGATIAIQLESGSTATDYTPYVDSLTPIPLQGNALASLPDGTKDVLSVDASGHVTIAKRTGNLTLDGSESWGVNPNVGAGFAYTAKPSDMASGDGASSVNLFLTDHFRVEQATSGGNVYASGANMLFFRNNDFNPTSGAEAKTWFTNNNTSAVYELSSSNTVDLGYITMPELADGCTVEVLASLSTPLQMVSYDGLADAESISVIRVNKDGSRTQLADHAANYTAIVDKYTPLNTAYVYEVVTYAESGAYAVEVTPNLLESTRWFAYWGENNIAWAQWNPSGSYTLARPEKKRVHYAGRKWPVSYDSKAMDQEHSMTWTVVDMDDWHNGFVDLMNDGGRGVYKGCDGWVFHADFDYSATPQYTSITRMGDMSLTISRIDGAQL